MYTCFTTPQSVTRPKSIDLLAPWFLLIIYLLTLLVPVKTSAQSVSEIITDYGGYWKSSASQVNAVKPDNSHNLLSFAYNGIRYSTGVNDALLQSHGDAFVAGDYKALPVSQLTGTVNSNTKIGLGAMYDGVLNGASNPAPVNNMVKYLSDGIKGLDLGTCVANLPAGDLYFPISNLSLGAIGDGIPDMIITQVADPSTSSLDSYEFTDILGNLVGNKVDIVLNNLQVVGNWTADFYEASTNPLTLQAGFTHTDRPIRLWSADLSVFGINSSNIQNIAYFKIRLNGNSDVAFVAYNNKAFNVFSSILALRNNTQVNNNPATTGISVFPNPTTDKIVVSHKKSTGKGQYQVRDLKGAIIMLASTPAGTAQFTLDVSRLPNGTYMITWNDNNEQLVKTFIKQ